LELKDYTFFFSVSSDKTLKFWDFLSNRSLKTRRFSFDTPQLIAMNNIFQSLICAGNKSITIWNITDGSCIRIISFYFIQNVFLYTSSRSDIFYIIGKFNKIHLYDLKTCSAIANIDFLKRPSLFMLNFFFFFPLFFGRYYYFIYIDNSKNLYKINQLANQNLRRTFFRLFLKDFIFSYFYKKYFSVILLVNKNALKIWDQITGLLVTKSFEQFYV
jgi:WD40 repeat protein